MEADQVSRLYPNLLNAERALRIGLLLDGPTINEWERAAIDLLIDSGLGTLELIIVNQEPFSRNEVVRRKSKLSFHPNELFWQYSRFDKRLNATGPDIFRPRSIDTWTVDVPRLDVTPITRRFVHRFTSDDVRTVRAYDLDILIRFGFNILRGEILTSARHGVWSYHHGDNNRFKGGPAYFWEIVERDPVSGVVLQKLSEKLDDGSVIFRSYGATADTMWHSQNQSDHFKKSASFISRCARQLISTGSIPGDLHLPYLTEQNEKIYVQPTNAEMLGFLWSSLSRKIASRLKRRSRDRDWKIALRSLEGQDTDFALELSAFRILENRPDAWRADPFIFEHGGEEFMFYEEYCKLDEKGHIRCARLNQGGSLIDDQAVLEEDFHLSYPFVFSWQGSIYMVPESFMKNEIRLYRCEEFPGRWVFEKTLLSGFEFVDATLHSQNGTWYLFVCTSECGGPLNEELFLFHAKTPLGPWQPHCQNPIKSDVRSARPAGRPFIHEGNLLRPAQDCTEKYGRRLSMCNIRTLSETSYDEELLFSYEPSSSGRLTGCHTISRGRKFEAIDIRFG